MAGERIDDIRLRLDDPSVSHEIERKTGELTGKSGNLDMQMDELRRSIRATATNLDRTVDAIETKFTLGQLVRSLAGKAPKESSFLELFKTISDSPDLDARKLGLELLTFVKENPLPSVLAGFGLGWILIGGKEGGIAEHRTEAPAETAEAAQNEFSEEAEAEVPESPDEDRHGSGRESGRLDGNFVLLGAAALAVGSIAGFLFCRHNHKS